MSQDSQVPADVLPAGSLPAMRYRDLPAPVPLALMLGPGVILAGMSLGSGEFILWPNLVYQSKFIFFWACVVGVTIQYFINMEITRWTLATGETAITGFMRLSRHWAIIFLVANLIPHVVPAWGTGAAKLLTWLLWPPVEAAAQGGEATRWVSEGDPYIAWIAIGALWFCGIVLTAGPVVYNSVERAQKLLVTLILGLVLVLAIAVVRMDAVVALFSSVVTLGYPDFIPIDPVRFPDIDAALLLGALAFAGCGGTLNLCQSNYVNDKGFGMGCHIGRITSALTGQEEAVAEVGYHFPHTEENLARWRVWWRRAGTEQFLSFFCTCLICLVLLTLISYSLFYEPDGAMREAAGKYGEDMDFILGEAHEMERGIGSWSRNVFLIMGIAILFTTELGILDAASRIAVDIVKIRWLRDNSSWTVSRLYSWFLWCEILAGTVMLLIGVDVVQKNAFGLFKFVSSINGGIMCIYSANLLWINCRVLPAPLRMSWPRRIVMTVAVGFFGFFAVWAAWNVLFGG